MQERYLKSLEFDKITLMLAERCLSPMGAEIAHQLKPGVQRLLIERSQQETSEAAQYLYQTGNSPLRPFDDIRPALDKARVGSMLSMGELLAVQRGASTSRNVKSQLESHGSEGGLLEGYAFALLSNKGLEEEISRCIVSSEEMSDQASPELARLRREIRLCHAKVNEKLNAIMRSSSKYLQDAIVTIRSGRYVLPVRQEYRAQVPGLVHDQSGSGATLFIEPMAVVEINNRQMELQGLEREEIERILRELTARVGEEAGRLQSAMETLGQLDFIFAKGKLSQDMLATEPIVGKSSRLHIKAGRHPLIPKDVVVPVSVWLGDGFTSLMITGPNTGGKTCTLKTCGLFALMAQAGLHIPALEQSSLPLFDQVFADIGDEQSIEQSLSTFSSHMTNLVSILGNVTPRSLVLLDELGAGTDPTEGAALAMAIMEKLRSQGVYAMATTHYAELKAYALTTNGVENASMEFDVASLSPTFRLTIGIPGKSNAFEISRRLGLPEDIIQTASQTLTHDQIRFEDVIKNAEYHQAMAEKERKVAEETRLEMEDLIRQTDAQRKVLETQRQEIIRKARDEAHTIQRRAKTDAEALLRDIKAMKDSVLAKADADRLLQRAGDMLRAAETEALEAAAEPQTPDAPYDPATVFAEGDYVRVVDINQVGTVLSPLNAKNELVVQVGSMKLSTRPQNLRREKAKTVRREQKRREPQAQPYQFRALDRNVPMQIDVHGMNAEEGMLEVDRYLDEAFMANHTEVTIIHGKGMGILRDAIHRLLRHHKHVSSFRSGRYGEGEGGVTIATLK